METPEHQEYRARQRVSIPAVAKTAAGLGLLFFVMSGGGPWSTAGSMNVIMGRDIPLSLPALIVGHFAVAFIYTFVIASVIFRFKTIWASLPVGVITGLVLYAVNALIFRGLNLVQQSSEGRTIFVHLSFGLFAAAVYRALAVPKPYGAPAEKRTTQQFSNPN
jgi:H+/Cl- antiporter ClcA